MFYPRSSNHPFPFLFHEIHGSLLVPNENKNQLRQVKCPEQIIFSKIFLNFLFDNSIGNENI
jgi:hypothetical protein